MSTVEVLPNSFEAMYHFFNISPSLIQKHHVGLLLQSSRNEKVSQLSNIEFYSVVCKWHRNTLGSTNVNLRYFTTHVRSYGFSSKKSQSFLNLKWFPVLSTLLQAGRPNYPCRSVLNSDSQMKNEVEWMEFMYRSAGVLISVNASPKPRSSPYIETVLAPQLIITIN